MKQVFQASVNALFICNMEPVQLTIFFAFKPQESESKCVHRAYLVLHSLLKLDFAHLPPLKNAKRTALCSAAGLVTFTFPRYSLLIEL